MHRADHIKAYNPSRRLWSHGIDCGDGSVIYYESKSPISTETVRQVPMLVFSSGERTVICDSTSVLKPYEVMRRAQGLLGTVSLRDLRGFDSENFARWCKTGRSGSEMFDTVLNALLRAAHQTARLSGRSSYVSAGEPANLKLRAGNPAFIEDVLM